MSVVTPVANRLDFDPDLMYIIRAPEHSCSSDRDPDPVQVVAGQSAIGIDFALMFGYVPRDTADHDRGNCVLTMTDQGILGFMDATQTQGSGFVYPRNGSNLLYIGSPWIGLDALFVANRDYDMDPAREFVVSSDPDGHIYCDDGLSELDIHSIYPDQGTPAPRVLAVAQWSWAFSEPQTVDDFVIISYTVRNESPVPIGNVYIGEFLDLDLGTSAYHDLGFGDPTVRLVYMSDLSGIRVGVLLLEEPDGSVPVANTTLIDNETFVYPNQYVLDPDKYAFLWALDPTHIMLQASEPGDYGILASAGPFVIGSMETRQVAFRIVGGESEAELLSNVRAAQSAYWAGIADVPFSQGATDLGPRLLPNVPNPFPGATTLRFEVDCQEIVRLSIFDVGGRVVRDLLSSEIRIGTHSVMWDGRDASGRDLPAGIYFARLESGAGVRSRSLILLR